MKNRFFISAGIFMLFIFCTPAFAQTQIRYNAQSQQDSVMVELPNNIKLLLITDDINKLQQLDKINLDSVVRKVNRQVQAASAGNIKTPPDTTTKNVNKPDLRYDVSYKRKNDQLALTLGAGAGLIRSQLVPKLSPTLALKRKRMEYSVTYDMNYFFERQENRQFKLYMNNFLDFGIGTKLFNRPENVDVYQKLTIGYLVYSKGDYFGKNTFKLSYSYPITNKAIRLMPELYITNNFKTLFPGISVNF
ncbi:hypothetical protein [Adhaeribacter rhizoryzae]|uniref:DUF3575 domain-containing protein n=1 Tax=Adhaeribacter rhizoryzae TaxID=2607907 RepID=A0A5M6DFU6_9BACT|nr:hypothetical protein [Adhaeribacter rhizoryzae]KAA5545059.1 hypothetical protein F0145_13480 [Adhaeribacter rhizoryzae]